MNEQEIIEPSFDYDFGPWFLAPPMTVLGGAFFSRLICKHNNPLFIQVPKCRTKQGVVNAKSGKKMYTDLMFDCNNAMFVNFIERLESHVQALIYKRRDEWFEEELEQEDIESFFTSSFKLFKSGKHYLMRVHLKNNLTVFDQHGGTVPLDELTSDASMLSIVEVQGLKFSSRAFQLEFELKQAMLVSANPFGDKCFIKQPTISTLIDQSVRELVGQKKDDDGFVEEMKEKEEVEDVEGDVEDVKEEKVEEEEDVEEEKEESGGRNRVEFLLDVEDLALPTNNGLEEIIDLQVESLEPMQLKRHNEVYYDMYRAAKEKWREAEKTALQLRDEMEQIKNMYMLDVDDENEE